MIGVKLLPLYESWMVFHGSVGITYSTVPSSLFIINTITNSSITCIAIQVEENKKQYIRPQSMPDNRKKIQYFSITIECSTAFSKTFWRVGYLFGGVGWMTDNELQELIVGSCLSRLFSEAPPRCSSGHILCHRYISLQSTCIQSFYKCQLTEFCIMQACVLHVTCTYIFCSQEVKSHGNNLKHVLVVRKVSQQLCTCYLYLPLWCHLLENWPHPFTPKSDQCQLSPAASPVILCHTLWRTWLFISLLTPDKRLLYYQFSLLSLIHFSVRRLGECTL